MPVTFLQKAFPAAGNPCNIEHECIYYRQIEKDSNSYHCHKEEMAYMPENKDRKDNKELFAEYLTSIFWRAFKARPFDAICTILRVGGLEDAHWDPFEESIQAFDDYDWMLDKANKERQGKASARIALLMYCQAIEMTASHEILMNLLRIINKERYHISPFGHLSRRKKKSFDSVPPSATRKFKEIKEKADVVGEKRLQEIINSFFNDKVRNAFSHSDYIITDKFFRWREGGFAQQIEIEHLKEIVDRCFSFYAAFLWCQKQWRMELLKARRFHKWPGYEILELLANKELGLYGFNVHFSNGNKATYERTPKGTNATNVSFERNGSVNFFVGSLDELTKEWKVNGKLFVEDAATLASKI